MRSSLNWLAVLCGRACVTVCVTAGMAACVSTPSTLTPKNIVQADAERAPRSPHYEYQRHCGKPCQSLSIRWQLDGQYKMTAGNASVITGRFSEAQVAQLSALYDELKTLSADLPNDLTRSTICQRFVIDNVVKIFAMPSTTDGWKLKDNHGCTGFEKAEALRNLEARIEAILPDTLRVQSR